MLIWKYTPIFRKTAGQLTKYHHTVHVIDFIATGFKTLQILVGSQFEKPE